MTLPTEAEWATAVRLDLIAANALPYDLGVIVPTSVKAFNYFSVADMFGGVPRMSAQIGTRGVRIVLRSVALYGSPADPLGNAREMRRRHTVALREKRLTINGVVTTPIQFESADPFEPDRTTVVGETWFSANTFYTCVI